MELKGMRERPPVWPVQEMGDDWGGYLGWGLVWERRVLSESLQGGVTHKVGLPDIDLLQKIPLFFK